MKGIIRMGVMTTPVNPQASPEAKRVMEYLGSISGKAIITGQHTQTRTQPELAHILELTGKLPALCGFELLAYSSNIDYEHSDSECLDEVRENEGTLENAMDWAESKKGLLTFTWHWFSPLGGSGKSFYAEKTGFSPQKALVNGTPENRALLSDMDKMAERLAVFRDKNIPVLWRPFHEADGSWFWWGSGSSHDVSKSLYRLMYERYTKIYGLNNLIWVWNSPKPACYPGDDVVDIISRDVYLPKKTHSDMKMEYNELREITASDKLAALGEIGMLPDIEKLAETHTPWCWYMTWSKGFCCGEDWNTDERLIKTYKNGYSITLDKLPALY